MIIVLKAEVTKKQVDHVVTKIKELKLKPVVSKGIERTIIGVIGDEAEVRLQPLEAFPGVEKVMDIQKPYKMVSRESRHQGSTFDLGKDVVIGGKKVVIMAGPCTVESQERIMKLARLMKKSGATVLRGGAFKPRTSPYDFQGLGEIGLKYLAAAKKATGLLIVTEMMDVRDLPLFERYADIIQIGARNMQNYNLLKEVGLSRKPILLKRGMANSIKEFLMAAEYIYSQGNHRVILCERGIRTFETTTRFTLDIGAVPVLKSETHLPVVIDPSHPAGKRAFVPALARAAVAAGADGLIVETHDKPEEAVCDGPQALLPEIFDELMKDLRNIARAIGRDI
ncbi:MAG TPA: 3-deoxy-7-phosphoheptulonate synthase [Verrucomicrobiae bacterium]|jgi:3-deoxy-7-phosphoheptulonate synthase|nr:3-deoxy-7-phosphoheptulonate synthase [Verrucomicrobiae bacterium]